MSVIRVAFFTAQSHSGKSCLSKQIRSELQIPVLESDHEVFGRIFNIFKEPELINHIGGVDKWQHLRGKYDFDRLFRLHHRDWYLRESLGKGFVAEGWIYHKENWRSHAVDAFVDKLPDVSFEFRLFHLKLNRAEYLIRHRSAMNERHPQANFGSRPLAEQQRAAAELFDAFVFEPPRNPRVSYHQVTTDDDLKKAIHDYLRLSNEYD